jgi:hypothetical protein
MATRSLIGVNLNNGITKIVYCHWDGYPSGVGQTLMENYTSPAAINGLMELGDLSALASSPEQSVAYHRDRKEPWGAVEPRDVNTSELGVVAQDYGVDYVYVYNDKFEWECYELDYDTNGLFPVTIVADVA